MAHVSSMGVNLTFTLLTDNYPEETTWNPRRRR